MKFVIEEKYSGIYYIIKEGFLDMQIVVTKELSRENHIWLNSLTDNLKESYVTELIRTTQKLEQNDDKNHADSLWEVVTRINREMIEKVRKDDRMCKALAEIMKPEIDEAFDNGFNNGKVLTFQNMINDGMPIEQAKKYAEISDQLAEKVFRELKKKNKMISE